jgi:hypothetical protein
MKRKIFTLLALASFVVAVSAQNKTMEIKPVADAAATPVIDADASDWTGTWVDFGLHNAGSTTNDMTGKFQLTYDNNCLYLVEEINDATANSDTSITNSYERDCSEVFISMDMDTVGTGNKYHDGVWQLRKQRGPEEGGVDGNNGKVGSGDNWNVTPMTTSAKFKALSSGASSPYILEWAIPWDSLCYNLVGADSTKVGLVAWGGKEFWFDIAIADNTTGASSGRSDQKYWNNNTDGQWNNVSLFGKVTLKVAVPTGEVVVKSATYKASSIRIKLQSIEFTNTTDVNVYDITGKLVIKANNVNSISTAALKSGVYVVTANDETKKFIK